jgi:hypothetical protein
MIAIWAAARTVHSKDVHRPVDALLEAIEARSAIASGRHAGLDALQDRCWGGLLRFFDRTRGSERYSLRLAAENNKTNMLKPKHRMLVVILKNTRSRLREQESASRKSRHLKKSEEDESEDPDWFSSGSACNVKEGRLLVEKEKASDLI